MSDHERRLNDEFRRNLQQRWVEAATTSQRPVGVDRERLWSRIDAQLDDHEHQPRRRDQERPFPGPAPRRSPLWAPAAVLATLALTIGLQLLRVPEAAPLPTLTAHLDEPRQSLMQPWRADCDVTRQSCELRTSLASVF